MFTEPEANQIRFELRRKKALSLMGLEDNPSRAAIRQRFVELARKNHPDTGAAPVSRNFWDDLKWARDFLLSTAPMPESLEYGREEIIKEYTRLRKEGLSHEQASGLVMSKIMSF